MILKRILMVVLFISLQFFSGGPWEEAEAGERLKTNIIKGTYVGGITEPEVSCAKLAEIGFNTIIVKYWILEPDLHGAEGRLLSGEKLESFISGWTAAAEKHDIDVFFSFNWQSPFLEPLIKRSRQYVGSKQEPAPCPLDGGYWESVVYSNFRALGELSGKFDFQGIGIDTEEYYHITGKYRLPCVCDHCWGVYRGEIPGLPALAASERLGFLREEGYLSDAEKILEKRIKELASRAREIIREYDETVILFTLDMDYDTPFSRGVALGLGEKELPLYVFSERTYRPGYYYPDRLREYRDIFKATDAHVRMVYGLWLTQFPPSLLPAHAYYLAVDENSSGYWIYTGASLLVSQGLHGRDLLTVSQREEYSLALKETNSEIARFTDSGGLYTTGLKVEPIDYPVELAARFSPGLAYVPIFDFEDLKVEPPPALRTVQRNTFYFHAREFEEFSFDVRFERRGADRAGIALLMGPKGREGIEDIESFTLPLNRIAEITGTAGYTGIHGFVVDVDDLRGYASGNVLSFKSWSHPVLVSMQDQYARFHGPQPPMYFYLPAGVKEGKILVRVNYPQNAIRCVLYFDGQKIGEAAARDASWSDLDFSVPKNPEGIVLKMEILPYSPENRISDITFGWTRGISPFIAFAPEHLLAPKY